MNMWLMIFMGVVCLGLAIFAFVGGYRLGLYRRRERLDPDEFRILGEEYEIRMRILLDENKELCRRWNVMGKVIASLGTMREKQKFFLVAARLLKENLSADYTAVLSNVGEKYELAAADGFYEGTEHILHYDINDPLISYIESNNEPIALTPRDRQFKTFELITAKIGEVLIMPMKMGGQMHGILIAARNSNRMKFTGGDKVVISYLGNAIGYLTKNIELIEELEGRTLKIITGLAKALEQKDECSRGHSDNVATYAVMFAKHIGASQEEINTLKTAALLHDIGSIGIPDRILNKPGKLTDEEFEYVKSHPMFGAELLKTLGFLKEELIIIMHHHEKFDGTGYPFKLRGNQIPLGAQIISIADVFDALTSDRPFRKAFGMDEALELMTLMSGKNFEPGLLNRFIEFIRHQLHSRRMASYDRT
ncbi:MAG: HD-GYP domain-containing protein [Firmicutes bacterium]|nr:HD-GYP domain-containing protein [Bacillota bacterium]